jgi:putative LysE/RhtB family amino acid efflux pump
MIYALLAGIVIGIVLAMPPGPVAVTAIRLSMDKGLRHGTLVGLGTAFMDFFYCLIAIFATSAVLHIVTRFVDKYPLLILAFQIVVVVAVIIFGVINIKQKNKLINPEIELPDKKISFLSKLSHKGPFLLGVAVALTNIANPTFLPTLAYLTVAVQKTGLIERSWISNILFSVGFGFGNFLWIYAVSKVIVFYKDKISVTAIARIHQFAGLTLIGVGTLLGYRVLTLTHWAEIARFAFAF